MSIVHSNPDARYVIFETSFSKPPYLDFYLDRFADDVHVTATIRRRAEAGNEESSIDRLAPEIRQSDFIIVVFIHHGAQDYPRDAREAGRDLPPVPDAGRRDRPRTRHLLRRPDEDTPMRTPQ